MATFTTNLPSMDFYGDLTGLELLLSKFSYTSKTNTSFTVDGPGGSGVTILGYGNFDPSGDFPTGTITKLIVYIPTGPNTLGYYQIEGLNNNFANLQSAIQDGSFREVLFFNSDTVTGSAGPDKLYGYNGLDTIRGGTGDDTLYGGEHKDWLYGDDGNDTVHGGNGDDVFYGMDGADRFYGGNGLDFASGGDGDDTLTGGNHVDSLFGGNGKDFLYGGADVDTLDGGAGNDVLHGDSNNDTLRGDEDDDSLLGGTGDDKLLGDDGDDFLMGETGKDTISGGEGNDTASFVDRGGGITVTLNGSTTVTVFVGGTAEDTVRNVENIVGTGGNDIITGDVDANELHGLTGIDTLNGAGGNDHLEGGDSNDTLRGGDGNDQILGDNGDDQLFGDAGNDVITGGLGKDTIDGGAGVDTVSYADRTAAVSLTLNGETNATAAVGGAAEDVVRNVENVFGGGGGDALTGNALANLLAGNGGNDSLSGGKGKDQLGGGAGNDRLVGGKGADVETGGAGNDQFVFDAKARKKSADTITDFNTAEDLIVLDNAAFKALNGKVLKGDYFHVGRKAADKKDLVIYHEKSGNLLYDADGKGGAKAKLIAKLDSGLDLTADDLIVV